jgi:hypothetical protein
LKGDTFDDLVEEDIKVAQVVERGEPDHFFLNISRGAMFLATKPKQLTHKKYWDSEAFGKSLLKFSDIHAIFDPTFRPPTFYRLALRENRRPTIAIKMSPSTEEKQVLGESRGNIRRRKDNG